MRGFMGQNGRGRFLSLSSPNVWLHVRRIPSEDNPEKSAMRRQESALLREAMVHLSHRERSIMLWRYGLDGGQELLFEEIAIRQDVTRERIRQIHEKVILRIQKILSSRAVERKMEKSRRALSQVDPLAMMALKLKKGAKARERFLEECKARERPATPKLAPSQLVPSPWALEAGWSCIGGNLFVRRGPPTDEQIRAISGHPSQQAVKKVEKI